MRYTSRKRKKKGHVPSCASRKTVKERKQERKRKERSGRRDKKERGVSEVESKQTDSRT